MADEHEHAPDQESDRENLEQTAGGNDPDARILSQADDPDAVRNALQREREAAKEAKRRADELAAKVAEFEDRDKTEQQKLTDRASSAEQRATQAEIKALRLEVALEKGLVGDRAALASRLQGNTKEELIADADQLLALVPSQPPDTSFDGGARGTPPNGGGMDGLIRSKLAARRG
jgi:hypothetical protein